MPPLTIILRILLFFMLVGALCWGIVWVFRYFAGAWTRWQTTKIVKKVEYDEKEVDEKIFDTYTKNEKKEKKK